MVFRVVKILWIVLCIGIMGWGLFVGADAILVATYLLGLLTMPTGLLMYVLCAFVIGVFAKENPNIGITYDHITSLVGYFLAISAGYIQWFILLPKIVDRMKKEKTLKIWGLAAVGLIAILYGLYRFYIHVFPNSNLIK